MTENNDSVTRMRFRVFVIVFRTSGIPLLYNKVPNFFNFYATLAMACSYVTFLAMVMDLFMNTEELERTMETLRVIFPALMIVWMHVFMRFQSDAIGRVMCITESFTWEELPTTDHETGYLTMAGWISSIELITKRLIQFTMTFHTSFIIIRMVLVNCPLSYNSWYPFDTSVSPVYELVYISQYFAVVAYACTVFGVNGLYATLVCIACSQLEKLRAALLDIRQKHGTREQDSAGAQTDQEEEQGQLHTPRDAFRHMQKQLNDCIRHHQNILSYIRAVEDTLNRVMAAIFLFSLASMCLCSFSIVTSWGNYIQVSQGVFGYVTAVIPIAIYCWFGHELSNQAESVRNAAWGCDWVGMPIPFQKCIRLIISAANKEFTLTAGKIVPVTISTFVNMVNQSASYFMFLLEVKNSIEQNEIN